MDKAFLKLCISTEVDRGTNNFFRKLYLRYFRPDTNAVFLIRKYLFYSTRRSSVSKTISKVLFLKLHVKYGIYVDERADIDLGLTIVHPMCVCIGGAQIGKNLTMYQGSAIAVNRKMEVTSVDDFPKIGDGCILYANSMIAGSIEVGDNISVGANSVLSKTAKKAGFYCGLPATLREKSL